MSKLNAKQIDVASIASPSANNLVQYKTDGLYMALAAAENVAIQYVSSSTGNDSNPGTRAAPLKTVYRALERLPESTSGQIYLLEGDVFPMRHYNDPEWGSATSEIGRLLVTSLKTILISAYGPQCDFYNSLDGNSGFNTFALAAKYLNRPILEFGHYMFNGSPVGTAFILGQNGGALVTLRAVEVRWAAATRAAAIASNKAFMAQGYQGALNCANVDLQGVILPSPIVTSGGALLAYSVVAYGKLNPWQVYVPVETSIWLNANGVNEITFSDSGATQTGNNGVTYDTLTSTVTTNLSTRIAGVVKDSNGIVRNVACNINL